MTLTEFLEYMIDNSDGPVTFSIAGAKVSVDIEGDKMEVRPKMFGGILCEKSPAKDVNMNRAATVDMVAVTERVCREANHLGLDWIAGHRVLADYGGKGSATTFLRSQKIPYTIFYGPNGKGTKMAFVRTKDL